MPSTAHRLAVFEVSGMTCGSCETRIRTALTALPGVNDAVVSRAAGRATVSHDPAVIDEAALAAAIAAAGYAALASRPGSPLPTDAQASRPGCGCCAR